MARAPLQAAQHRGRARQRAYDCRQPLLVDAPRLWATMEDADSVMVRIGDL